MMPAPMPTSTTKPQKPQNTMHAKQTPISLLNEMCMKRKIGIVPQFSCVVDGKENNGEFTMEVSLGEMKANGTDSSKKRGKHLAALNLMIQLVTTGWEILPGMQPHLAVEYLKTLIPPPSPPKEEPRVKSGTQPADAPLNPISKLNELCQVNAWPMPKYTIQAPTEGQAPNEFTTTVEVGKFVQADTAIGKKTAKRGCAEKMFNLLSGNIEPGQLDSLSMDDSIAAETMNLLKKLVSLRGKDANEVDAVMGAKIGKALKAASKVKNHRSPAGDSVVLLAKVADKAGFKAVLRDLDMKSKDGEFQCMYWMSFPPTVLTYGCGSAPEAAREHAAKGALQFLTTTAEKFAAEE